MIDSVVQRVLLIISEIVCTAIREWKIGYLWCSSLLVFKWKAEFKDTTLGPEQSAMSCLEYHRSVQSGRAEDRPVLREAVMESDD